MKFGNHALLQSLHSHTQKILIVQTAFIGDVILTIPLAKAISGHLPTAEIHFLTIPNSRELIETLPFIHHVWIFDKRGEHSGIIQLFKYARKIRSEDFDLAIIPHRSFRSALLIFLSGIRNRIGFDRSSGNFLFTKQIAYPIELHEIERNMTLLKAIGLFPKTIPHPEIRTIDTDRQEVSLWLKKHDLYSDKNFICMAPGSIWPTKRWPSSHWGELIRKFNQKKITTILIGSQRDHSLAPEIVKYSGVQTINAMGQFSLRESAEIIRRSSLLISNDSAPTHMGVAVDTPVLTIFGSTIPQFGFYPYGKKNRVIEIKDLDCRPCTDHGRYKCPVGHFRCMRDITPNSVFQIAWEMIHADIKD